MLTRCLILEDQAPARRLVEDYVQQHPKLELMGATAFPEVAEPILVKQDVDLLFLDLHLPQTDGFRFLKSLTHPPQVIVTTAFPKRALEGFEAGVIDYLVKPFSYDRFALAVERALARAAPSPQQERLNIPVGRGRIVHIAHGDIIRLEADGDYVSIHTTAQTFHVLGPLSAWMERLPAEDFAQIHRSHIVNRTHITERRTDEVRIGNQVIRIGDTYGRRLTW